MKTLIKIIMLSIFSVMFLAKIASSEECKDDPNQCSPKDLCNLSTEILNDQKFWTTNLEFISHVKFAKDLGIDCGALEPSSPCDLNADECKISELCERATIGETVKSWNPEKPEYVGLAQEFNLTCGVSKKKDKTSTARLTCEIMPAQCDEAILCEKATEIISGSKRWIKDNSNIYLEEAKWRALDCGVANEDFTENKITVSSYKAMLNEIRGDWSGIIKCTNQNFPFSGTFFTKPKNRILFETDDFNYKGEFSLDHLGSIITVKAIRNDGQTYNETLKYSKELKTLTGKSADCFVEAKKSQTGQKAIFLEPFVQSDFNELNLTKRKQMQYALKELGYYNAYIDGLYGPNTEKAVRSYAKSKGLTTNYPESIYKKLTSEVKVPSSFATIKKSKKINTNKIANTKGWVPLSGNPKLSFDDAKDICEAKAEAEGQTYMSANQPRSRSNNFNCQSIGTPMPFGTIQFNNYSCSRNSGGFWGGFASALENSQVKDAARDLARAVAKACMADFGWKKN